MLRCAARRRSRCCCSARWPAARRRGAPRRGAAQAAEPDPHAVLGVQRGAPPRAIRARFLALARRMHPDVGGSNDEFRQVVAAYEALACGSYPALPELASRRRRSYSRRPRRGGERPGTEQFAYDEDEPCSGFASAEDLDNADALAALLHRAATVDASLSSAAVAGLREGALLVSAATHGPLREALAVLDSYSPTAGAEAYIINHPAPEEESAGLPGALRGLPLHKGGPRQGAPGPSARLRLLSPTASGTGPWGRWGLRLAEASHTACLDAPAGSRLLCGYLGWQPRALDQELRQQRWKLVPAPLGPVETDWLLQSCGSAVWRRAGARALAVPAAPTPCGWG
eukprot:TRINITY_DN60474_c0_g1_i1.p1 TRINITY_DN60474_c0_g1~~TRINITY_DN60474_c0_g1_i1.p1  ORF type:complete len:342 (+),score=59.59 TRINITY_DN60474_c0_g1_i1:65-1090(+)